LLNNKDLKMREEKNRSLLIWVIVALAVLNISTLGTILYQRYSYNKNLKLQSLQTPPGRQYGGTLRDEYFSDRLNFSQMQLEQFRKFNPDFRKNAQTINFRLSELRNEMITEMGKSNYDTTRLNELSDLIGYQHSTLKRLTYNYYLDIRNICDSQQQQLLEDLFAETLMYDRNPGNQGGGRNRMRNRGGMHRGWNR